MEYIFWVLLSLFFVFLGLSVYAKRTAGKTKFRYVIPMVVFTLPVLLLSGIYVYYHTQLKPQPTTSAFLLENEEFRIGHGTKPQPATLDDYVQQTASQIGKFNKRAESFWPGTSFDGAVVYFISNDRKNAWKVEYDGSYTKVENVKSVPRHGSVLGYEMEFFPLRVEIDGVKGMVIVISQDALLDQKSYEKYTHLGTYDPLLTYIHEGFHLFAQDGDRWENADVSTAIRENALDNLEARKLRTYTLKLLSRALQDEENRDLYMKQAVKLHQEYKTTFVKEYERVRYFERIEGTASYYEVVASLQVSYPETIHETNYAKAVALWSTHRRPEEVLGASHEAYELGILAGVLLDLKSDPSEWKEKIERDPETTPMDLIEGLYTKEELDEVDVPEISEEFALSLLEPIDRGQAVKNNLLGFLYHVFF